MRKMDVLPPIGRHSPSQPPSKHPYESSVRPSFRLPLLFADTFLSSSSLPPHLSPPFLLLSSTRQPANTLLSLIPPNPNRVWAMYTANTHLLSFLLLYITAQTAAGLWQYTVPGATPAPDPVDNYEFHCEFSFGFWLLGGFLVLCLWFWVVVCVRRREDSCCFFSRCCLTHTTPHDLLSCVSTPLVSR